MCEIRVEIGQFYDPGRPDPYHRKADIFVNGRSGDYSVTYWCDGSQLRVMRNGIDLVGVARWGDLDRVKELVREVISPA